MSKKILKKIVVEVWRCPVGSCQNQVFTGDGNNVCEKHCSLSCAKSDCLRRKLKNSQFCKKHGKCFGCKNMAPFDDAYCRKCRKEISILMPFSN